MHRTMTISKMGAIALAMGLTFASVQAQDVAVDQGWNAKQKTTWYTLTQGSRLIPLAWMRALEQPGSDKPFLDKAHVEKFRYLPQAGPGALPVGFTIDAQSDRNLTHTRLRWKANQNDREPWFGMNCSACHTNEIAFKGKRMRIEGAPAVSDFQGFMEAFNTALRETRDNPDKWNRFATAVLKGADTPGNRNLLKEAFAKHVAWERKVAAANATPLRYGYGRLDAFGHIFNKVALLADPEAPPNNPADAPVSYPFLWNIPQHDKVQWNGIAKNRRLESENKALDIGALARNAGEVVGVFGDVKLVDRGLLKGGYPSSINVANLQTLEGLLTTLLPPAWPTTILGPINEPLRKKGEELYTTKGCVNCHESLDRKDLKTPITAVLTPLQGPEPAGTDVWMACNAYTYEANTGILRHALNKYFFGVPFLQDTAPVAEMLANTVLGSLHVHKGAIKKDVAEIVFGQKKGSTRSREIDINLRLPDLIRPERDSSRAARFERCMTEVSPILAYKGRPLTGIWATPPYLHSGSVPTLYDLLLPPADRPKSFFLGTREFNPEKVGFVTERTADNTFEFRTHGDTGRMIDGNSNAGHDYNNAGLSEEDRKALVEYMKSL